MAIRKKLIHFGTFSNFNSQKLSANKDNSAYTVGIEGSVVSGEPNILFESIVFIKDVKKIWTHAGIYDCNAPDLSGYLTSEEIAEVYATVEQLNSKQEKSMKFENVEASAWVSDTTYPDYPYRCDVICNGVTADDYAEVVFDIEQATSGNYAPVCETLENKVAVWSKENAAITILSIIITK